MTGVGPFATTATSFLGAVPRALGVAGIAALREGLRGDATGLSRELATMGRRPVEPARAA